MGAFNFFKKSQPEKDKVQTTSIIASTTDIANREVQNINELAKNEQEIRSKRVLTNLKKIEDRTESNK